jgi:hypothetical protein
MTVDVPVQGRGAVSDAPPKPSRARAREIGPTDAEFARARRWWIEQSGLTRDEIAEIAQMLWA